MKNYLVYVGAAESIDSRPYGYYSYTDKEGNHHFVHRVGEAAVHFLSDIPKIVSLIDKPMISPKIYILKIDEEF